MTVKQGRWIFIILLIGFAVISFPAAGAPVDTPLSPSEISIRQAHLEWIALSREAEMNAAIAYIYPLYETDTARLNSLLADFKSQESLIPATTTGEGFANLSREMRSITVEFRNETGIQMAKGHGKPADLSQKITAATINNPYIDEKKAAYWDTRRTRQLADFDAWARASQSSLDTLRNRGYDTAAPQRTLDVIASKRPDLQSALESKSDDRIIAVNGVILPLTRELGQQVQESQTRVSEAERIQFSVDQGYRAVYRADAINQDLTAILLDIGPPEPALKKLKTDLVATTRALNTGNLPLAKTPLTLVKKDLKDLSATYRDIASSQDLPPDLTASLRSMVITLDAAADRMGVD